MIVFNRNTLFQTNTMKNYGFRSFAHSTKQSECSIKKSVELIYRYSENPNKRERKNSEKIQTYRCFPLQHCRIRFDCSAHLFCAQFNLFQTRKLSLLQLFCCCRQINLIICKYYCFFSLRSLLFALESVGQCSAVLSVVAFHILHTFILNCLRKKNDLFSFVQENRS